MTDLQSEPEVSTKQPWLELKHQLLPFSNHLRESKHRGGAEAHWGHGRGSQARCRKQMVASDAGLQGDEVHPSITKASPLAIFFSTSEKMGITS